MADPTTDAAPEPDPSGLQAALARSSDAFGNISFTPEEYQTVKSDLFQNLGEEKAVLGKEEENLSTPFAEKPPTEDPHLLGGLFPMLAIGALGGKAAKLNASAMLGANIGMVQGYLSGKEDVYQDNLAKWKAQYQAFKDRQDQQDKIYKEMREAYKGRIDADIKALQFARQVTGDEAKNVQTLVRDQEALQKSMDQLKLHYDQLDDKKNQEAWQRNMAQRKFDLAKQQTGANITYQTASLAADRILNGEKTSDVLGNLGRGKQGAADIAMVQNLVSERAAERDMPAEEIATKKQELAAEARTRLELGAREGKIAPRVQEAQNFAKMALDASDAVPRKSWMGANELIQKWQKATSDPPLRAFQAANNSFVNAYAAAIGGGTIHVGDQEHAREMLSTAMSAADYKASVDQLIKETQGALAAPQQVMGGLRNPTPVAPAVAPSPSDAAPPPVAPPPAAPPQGNVVHWGDLPSGSQW
jgi:hypothetical protein